ncbi:hypothetical protein RGU12_20085 [Fredinandcohnia sp. QZ13]|uniref:hypothetical protein n=1 Tax=Fredinandcohnia sp. QZ13 TaxID=3073144 RepID=UPI0028534FB3|nr:hypothetical protein [Fredinandcohnia sp. QZ13]MDR4889797.1 hypothetical protein [Fredinandcohnia sp. QZ13]
MMLTKIKALPEKKAFLIGFSLIIISPILLLLFTLFFNIGNWIITIIQGIIWCFAFLFIVSAAYKRHSRTK